MRLFSLGVTIFCHTANRFLIYTKEAVMKRISSVSAIVLLITCAISVLTVSYAVAQERTLGDRQSTERDAKRWGISASASSSGLAASSHIGLSPFPTPTPTDTRFVVDSGYAGLDTGCTYRSQGSLKFKIAVKRYVGPINGDGTLTNPQKLKDNGVVSEFATLRMPAKDVDFDTPVSPPYNPERDRVLFNGVPIGNLEGDGYFRGIDNTWIMNEFKVPINLVRFAQKGTNGNEPTGGENEIEVLIDQANVENGEDLWCTQIDWAELSFQAMAPVIMVAGNGQCSEFFEGHYFCNSTVVSPGLVQPFKDQDIPYDNTIDMRPANSIKANSEKLLTEIPKRAKEFGAKWIHIVGHSKGGLDVRDFLTRIPKDSDGDSSLGVLSLITLATPHHGSVGADIVVRSREANIIGLPLSDQLRNVLIARFLQSVDKGRRSLTTSFLDEDFNPENLPKLPDKFTVSGETHPINYFSFAADANIDNSNENNNPRKPTIQQFETIGTGRSTKIMTEVYRFLGNTKIVEVERVAKIFKRINIEQTSAFEDNDYLVTVTSAHLPEKFAAQQTLDLNHATIMGPEVGILVIPLIKASQSR